MAIESDRSDRQDNNESREKDITEDLDDRIKTHIFAQMTAIENDVLNDSISMDFLETNVGSIYKEKYFQWQIYKRRVYI